MRKLNKKVLQYGVYVNALNRIRFSLHNRSISQADFAAYLCIDPKSLSDILNGVVVPNAAFFMYLQSVLYRRASYSVFFEWLMKFGRSSLSRFRSRKFSLIELPE